MFNLKKNFAFTFLFFSLFFLFSHSLTAEDLPKSLSKDAIVSIVSVNYSDYSHSYFSKNCLRFYDKQNGFDKIIDFAHFENFDDDFFFLKFFLKSKKAHIKIKNFFEFFLRESNKTTVSLSEIVLNLSPEEISYIYSFIYILNSALPNYTYDFDILTNNSETHISQILHDAQRMYKKGKITENNTLTNDSFLFSTMTFHKLQIKRIENDFITVNNAEKFDLNEQTLLTDFETDTFSLVIILSIASAFFFLITAYQIVVYFFKKFYVLSFYKSIQIFDFLILFIAGFCGLIILLQDFFSDQTLFRNNYQFILLNPFHLIAAFSVFRPIKNAKIECYYWLTSSVLSIVYFVGVTIFYHKVSLVNLFFVLPFFLRTLYYGFLSFEMLNYIRKVQHDIKDFI